MFKIQTTFSRQRLLITGFLGLVLLLGMAPVYADSPANVGLREFTATPLDNAVDLVWITETEIGTAGFLIYRSPGAIDDFHCLLEEKEAEEDPDVCLFTAGNGTPSTGHTYEVTDETAVNGQTYTYKLVEVENNSNEVDLETVTVTLDGPTATPIVISGPQPTATQMQTNPTNTPSPTRTPTRAATATPTSTAVSQSSPTPRATNTATATPTATGQTTPTGGTAVAQVTAVTRDARSNTDDGVALAQEEPTATPDTGYPGPESTPIIDAPNESYPGEATPFPTPPPPSPYPDNLEQNGAATPTQFTIIGDGPAPAPSPVPDAQAQPAAGAVARGRVFLWGGFILAFLLFATGVLGAIYFFTRKRE